MNDEEKARIRERLGLRYFEILLEGMCPYCGRELVEATTAVAEGLGAMGIPEEMLAGCTACVPCKSIWNKPEFGGAGDENAVERMRRTWRSTSKKGRH